MSITYYDSQKCFNLFSNAISGAGWYVDHVIVKEGRYAAIKEIDEKERKESDKKATKKPDKGKTSKDKDKKGKKEDKSKEDKTEAYRKWYFPCSRWFDEGVDDGFIERLLEPGEPPVEDEIAPGQYSASIFFSVPVINVCTEQVLALMYRG